MTDQTNATPILTAHLVLFKDVHHARKHPVFTNFRSGWRILNNEGELSFHDGPIKVISSEIINPGDQGTIEIYPLVPKFWSKLEPGMDIEMCEGPNVIGKATILSIEWRRPE